MKRYHRFLAAVLTASMLLSHNIPLSSLAEETPVSGEDFAMIKEAEESVEPSSDAFDPEAAEAERLAAEEAERLAAEAAEAERLAAEAAEAAEAERLAAEQAEAERLAAEAAEAERLAAEAAEAERLAAEAAEAERLAAEAAEAERLAAEAAEAERLAAEAAEAERLAAEAAEAERLAAEAAEAERLAAEAAEAERLAAEAAEAAEAAAEANRLAGETTEQKETTPEEVEVKETEEATEKITEPEVRPMGTHFTASGDGVEVEISLLGGTELPADTEVRVSYLGKSDALAQTWSSGARVLADSAVYQLQFTDEGTDVTPDCEVEAFFTFTPAATLGVSPYRDGMFYVYQSGGSPVLLTDVDPEMAEGNQPVLDSVQVTVPAGAAVAFAGVQNRVNDGEMLHLEDLMEDLEDILAYPVLANDLINENSDGQLMDAFGEGGAGLEPEYTDLTTSPDEEKTTGEILEDLSDVSLELANASSSDEITVINLYADEDGFISTQPLGSVLHANRMDLDVTNRYLLINIVADSADQELDLPVFSVIDDNAADDGSGAYSRLLMNITAYENGVFVPYTGEAAMNYATGGTWLVPDGSVTVKEAFLGALYADRITFEENTVFVYMPFNDAENAFGNVGKTAEEELAEAQAAEAAQKQSEQEQTEETELPMTEEQTEETELPIIEEQTEETELPITEEQTEETELPAAVEEEETELPAASEKAEPEPGVEEEEKEEAAPEALGAPDREKAKITITSASGEWEYDKEAHSALTYTVTLTDESETAPFIKQDESDATGRTFLIKASEGDDDAEADKLVITPGTKEDPTEPAVTYPADTKDNNNTFTYQITGKKEEETDVDVTDLYGENITSVFGTLTVTNPDTVISTTTTKEADTVGGAAQPHAGAVYQLTDADGKPLEKESVQLDNATSGADGKAGFTLKLADYGLYPEAGEEKIVKIHPVSGAPEGYYTLKGDTEIAITRDDHGLILLAEKNGSVAPADTVDVSYYYEKPKTVLTLTVSTTQLHTGDTASVYLDGQYELRQSGTAIKNNAGAAIAITTAKAAAAGSENPKTVTIDFSTIAGLWSALKPGEEIKDPITLYLQTPPAGGYLRVTEDQTFLIGKDANGNLTARKTASDELLVGNAAKLSFDYMFEKPVTLKVNTVRSTNEKTVIPDAVFTLLDTASNQTLKGPDGKEVTLTMDKNGSAEVVFDTANYAVLKALAASGKLTVKLQAVSLPTGYVMADPDQSFIIEKDAAGNLLLRDPKGKKGAETLTVKVPLKPLTVSFTVSAIDIKDKKKLPLAGATYVIRKPDGTMLKGSDGAIQKTAVSEKTKKVAVKKYTIDLTNPSMAKIAQLLMKDGSLELTVSELTPPTGSNTGKSASYKIVPSPDYVLKLELDPATGEFTINESKKTVAVQMRNEKLSEETVNSDSIRVTKRLYHENSRIYPTVKATYYAALFSDKDLKNRVSEVMPITFAKGAFSASKAFTNLEAGTYYIGETDKYGTALIKDSKKAKKAKQAYYIEIDPEMAEVSELTSNVIDVSIANHYFKMPSKAAYFAELTVRKVLQDEEGKEKNSSGEFYFYVYNQGAQYPIGTTQDNSGNIKKPEPQVISMGGGSKAEKTIRLGMTTDTRSVFVRECDKDGNEVNIGKTYKITYSDTGVTLSRDQAAPPVITITNRELGPQEGDKGTATLTLTKKVTYKGEPMRVNAAYYIGIFKSSKLTKENLLSTASKSVRALPLRNASEYSSVVLKDVNLDNFPNRSITLYFAETDREGNPVQSGSTGYNISINGQAGNAASVTLNAKNPKAEVVVTNDIIAGGSQEKRLTDGGSGFAGDSRALAEAQEMANQTTATATKTGDDTPILPLVGLLGGSAAVILIILLIILRRRRR